MSEREREIYKYINISCCFASHTHTPTQRGVCATCAPICTVDYITGRNAGTGGERREGGREAAWGKHLDLSYGLHLINKLIFQSTNRCGVCSNAEEEDKAGRRGWQKGKGGRGAAQTAVKSSMLPKI